MVVTYHIKHIEGLEYIEMVSNRIFKLCSINEYGLTLSMIAVLSPTDLKDNLLTAQKNIVINLKKYLYVQEMKT